MKSLSIILVICIALLATQGCYYDKEEILYPSACDTTAVTYAQTVKPMINAYCLSCHGTSSYNTLGGAMNLDGYTNLIKQVQNGQLLKSIKHEAGASPMPKNQQQLSDCNIAKIQRWINATAPNN
jgi:mono/diheme cytochrome c family protein